jgi:beta-lactamase superfamily II metal-dependent hydrolase
LGTAPGLDKLLKSQFLKDQAKPNGSSIAVLAEYQGRSVMLLADAHPDTVAESVKKLCQERGVSKLAVGAVKVSHHGSKGNTSVALIDLIDSPRWLISTNGDRFKHPHKPCMARIVKHGRPKEVWFNYSSKYTKPWLAKEAQKAHGYKAVVRSESAVSLALDL